MRSILFTSFEWYLGSKLIQCFLENIFVLYLIECTSRVDYYSSWFAGMYCGSEESNLCPCQGLDKSFIPWQRSTCLVAHSLSWTRSIDKHFVKHCWIQFAKTRSINIGDGGIDHSCPIKIVDKGFAAGIGGLIGDYERSGIRKLDCLSSWSCTKI